MKSDACSVLAALRSGCTWNNWAFGGEIVKPWPADLGQWSHFLHDASNNAVTPDRRVGPPQRLKWLAGPRWSRSHEFVSSFSTMVSSGGRVFYVVDEGLTSLTDAPLPERWALIARDAFNGVELWRRALPQWRGDEWKTASLRGRPASVQRRFVASDDRLFATMSHTEPVVVCDAATGEVVKEIEGTESAQEILVANGTLVARLAPLGTRRGPVEGWLVGVGIDDYEVQWRVSASRYQPQSACSDGERLVFSDTKQLVVLEAVRWRRTLARRAPHGRSEGRDWQHDHPARRLCD